MIINKPLIDYLTITTASENEAEEIWNGSFIGVEHEIEKRFNYTGSSFYDSGGNWFLGEGVQDGEKHFMLQVSGEAAEVAFLYYNHLVIDGTANCSRIDVQRTIEKPENWSQSDLILKCEEQGLKPEVRRSHGEYGELVTVYTGKRTSGRMNRTYEKETKDGERFIRFETEFGRHYAKAVFTEIATGKATRQAFINGEVMRRKSVGMFEAFKVDGSSYTPKPKVKKEQSKTGKWILNTVLPCLVKYKNQHDHDPKIIQMVIDALTQDGQG